MPWSGFIKLMYVVKYGTDHINTVDALISVTFRVFKLVISDVKVDFLIFTRLVAMHYLKAAKVWK